MRSTASICLLLSAAFLLAPATAFAQSDSTLIQPAIPPDYDRGRNVSVQEKPRPDYDPLGIRAGGFIVYPRLEVGGGATDNVYLTSTGTVSDVFTAVSPSIRAESDWNRNQATLAAGGRFRRYAGETLRNQNEWYVNGLGRLDLGNAISVTGEAQAALTAEEPFSGEAESNIAALSSYRRNMLAARAEYRVGRIRTIIAYDFNSFSFEPVTLTSGARVNQDNRDRDVHRVTGQVEYAFTPSLAVYSQIGYANTSYAHLLAPGVANRDSNSVRVIAGVSLDMSGFFRGIVGIGFTSRQYSSPLYKDVNGFSAEARLEYFPTELTTFTLGLSRVLQDSNLAATSAYFDNMAALKVDHELLRNLILTAGVQYHFQDYVDSRESSRIWRVEGGGRYLASRLLSFQLSLSYANRFRDSPSGNFSVNEARGLVSIILQP